MIVGQQHEIDSGQLVQVDSRIRAANTRDSRPKMHMIARMEEVGLYIYRPRKSTILPGR